MCGYVDDFDVKHLEFVKLTNSRAEFPWFARYTSPKSIYINGEEYRAVPGYPNLAVNCSGRVIHPLTSVPYQTLEAHGYDAVYCWVHRYRKKMFVQCYKAVALAWVNNPDPDKYVVVDHFDGNKKNNHYTNLVWSTYKENSDRAVERGLIKSAIRCRVRDIHTGEIKEFNSLESMNSFLGLRAKEENHFLTRKCNNVYAGRYEVRIDGDNRDWIYTDNCQNVEPSRYIITVKEPDTVRVFNGVRTLISHYKLWNMSSTSCAVAVKVLKERHPEFEISVNDQYDTRRIELKDLSSGEVSRFDTVRDLVEATGLCKATVLAAIKHNGRKVIDDRFVARRESDDDWPDDIIKVKNRPIGLKIINKDTLEEMMCTSVKDAARKLGCDREYITRCMTRPKENDKYIIQSISPFLE